MLMFCKTSIQSFAYNLIDIFMFTDEIVKNIYDKNEVIKCFLYQNLIDTDYTSFFLVSFLNFHVLLTKKTPEI